MNDTNDTIITHSVDHLCLSKDNFISYIISHDYNENMFNKDGTLNMNYNSLKKTGSIANILDDNWNSYYELHQDEVDKYRPNANKEILKVIDCYNKNLGCSVYECPDCHEYVFIGHTCKSRMCSSCGYKYKSQRVENILETAYNCPHRQIVFTIAEELRPFFFYPFEKRMNILFKAVEDTIYSILNDSYKSTKNKKKKKYSSKVKYTPGFFMFLHTFGRDLKWNPHIHVLIAEIKMGGDLIYKKWNYFNYDALSLRFQKILLDLLSKEIGKDFDNIKRKCFINHKKGFYVHAEPKKFKSFKDGVEYVTRYCGRPAISENRIINYDGKNVTFCYNDHKDESYHEITCTSFQFIAMLLRHLTPSNFKTIRYCGFYRKKHKNHDKMVLMVNPVHHNNRKAILKHRLFCLKSFNHDPYSCPKCNKIMIYMCDIIKGG